jgi:hypothetical protein
MSTATTQDNNMSVETTTEQQQQQQDEKLDSVLLCNRVVKGTKEDIEKLRRMLKRLEGKTAYRKIKHLIGHGCCMDWSIQTMAKNRVSAYQQIKKLLQHQTDDNDTIMLTQREVDSLCEYYKFFIHDVSGFYPETSPMLTVLRSAKICDDEELSKYDAVDEREIDVDEKYKNIYNMLSQKIEN